MGEGKMPGYIAKFFSFLLSASVRECHSKLAIALKTGSTVPKVPVVIHTHPRGCPLAGEELKIISPA
jgi:hypothetical protein